MYELYIAPGSCHCPDLSAAELNDGSGGPISSGDDLLEWVTAADGKGLGLAQKSK